MHGIIAYDTVYYTISSGSHAYWGSLFLLTLLASGSFPPTSLSGLDLGLLALFLLILLFALGLTIVLVSKSKLVSNKG
jgi:hypothetical protein